jgi:hypothetical protein
MPFKTFATGYARGGRGRGDETFYMPSGMVMVVPNQTKGDKTGQSKWREEKKKWTRGRISAI